MPNAITSSGRLTTSTALPALYDDNNVIGAVGVSGSLPDDDEACAIHGIGAAGLRADPERLIQPDRAIPTNRLGDIS